GVDEGAAHGRTHLSRRPGIPRTGPAPNPEHLDEGENVNGPQHYAEAERILAIFEAGEAGDTMATREEVLTAAQVHATLALAAAVALGTLRAGDHGMPAVDSNAWIEAASADEILVGLATSAAPANRPATDSPSGWNVTASGGSIA